ncbi:MAG: hypothetical protein ACLQRH_08040, partial [Acidimicrobiales bacterium]
MSKIKHWNQRQRQRTLAFFGNARRLVICSVIAVLVVVGVGVGLSEGASTGLALTGGQSASVTCSGKELTTSRVSKTAVNLTCVAS